MNPFHTHNKTSHNKPQVMFANTQNEQHTVHKQYTALTYNVSTGTLTCSYYEQEPSLKPRPGTQL